MPEARRRYPDPDPSEFANPRAEKMYWATDRLLDEAPPTGELRMRYLYDSWHRLREEFLQKGETNEEARLIAWGVLAFFTAKRVAEMHLEVVTNEQLKENFPISELDIVEAWIRMQEDHYDARTDSYIGEPFFSTTRGVSGELRLGDYPSAETVDPGNSDSPLFGHIQLLDKAADRQPISEEIKNAVLAVATNRRDFLEHEIENWNEALNAVLPERVDEEDWTHLLETKCGVLILTMVDSWGNEETPLRRLELLEIYLDHFREGPNPFQDFLTLEGFDLRFQEWRRRLGGPETDEEREYYVPGSALAEIKFQSSPELKNIGKPAYYSITLEGYKGLDFGLIITWVPELQLWLGNAIISYSGNEPPRSITLPIRLLDVQTPAEAAAGLIRYYQEHLEAFYPPKKASLTKEERGEALQQLRTQDIRRLGIGEDLESNERAIKHIRSLLDQVQDFKEFPSLFSVAASDNETDDIHWAICEIDGDRIYSNEINTTEDSDNLIKLVDKMTGVQNKLKKVLVCSDSLYQLIIKDPKSKIRSTFGIKTVIKRPAGLITIYRGYTLH